MHNPVERGGEFGDCKHIFYYPLHTLTNDETWWFFFE